MNTYQVNYRIISRSTNKYLVLADFHGNFNLKLAKDISKNDAKYIIIAGDLLNGYAWTNHRKLVQLKKFLDIISDRHKVILCLGNHDLWHLSKEGFENFRNLENDNVITLFNETKIVDDNAFTNFLPSKECYSYLKQDKTKIVNKIIKQYEKIQPSSSKHIRHLISHNPYHFWHTDIIKDVAKNYDIIEVGHFHDGWVPTKYLNKHYDTCLDKGIQEIIKNKFLFTNYLTLSVNPKRNLSRGIVYMYVDGYYLLLPNNKVYYYDRVNNHYQNINKEMLIKRLKKEKTPALVITGAINTFMNLKVFYPYMTTVELSNKYDANVSIKEIN